VRRQLRNEFSKTHILEQMVRDIKYLLDDEVEESLMDIALWNNHREFIKNGISYGKEIDV
jgi:hypothetical protein